MIAPEALISELMQRARRDFYSKRPDKQWYQQQDTVKKALTFPAAWLEERKVPISATRYREIVSGILDTALRHGQIGNLAYPSAYLLKCVQEHMAHHGDEYYQEGKGIRNRVSVFMTDVERAHKGDDATVPVLASVHAALAVGKSKGRPKSAPTAAATPDLFANLHGKPRRPGQRLPKSPIAAPQPESAHDSPLQFGVNRPDSA